jgi:DNA-binding SARP family transcriptional activator/tetratricopeptide (TPR) repeat protein/type II secretory pathway predicted ATPase ExeA
MDSQRFLRCLGQPALFASNGEPIRFRTRKHLALLVYIAVENRSHRRDRLAELLWPKVSGTEARHSLATALSVLRPRLGLDGLETSRDHVRLVPGRVTLDLDRLQSGDVLGSEMTEPLQVAAFLDGFDIVDSVEFTLWKDQQQARLLPVIKDALLILIDRCRRTGDTRQIEQVADRMLALDYLCEDAIRAKMEARAFAGDRLTALEIFESWKKKLAEELHAVPSELVEGMAVRLRRRGWERTTLANIPNVPTDQWRGRPFVGRAAEYRLLYERWEAVHKGGSGHALILGDSGVGKTTLVQRLTTAAGLEGAAISRVQCYDLEREIPYSTLSNLIAGLVSRPGASATSPEALAELSRTVPRIRHRFLNLPAVSDTQGETARLRFTEAFHEMLTAIADEQPVVLVVDDLHLADDVSLAVLHLILRRVHGQRIMAVLIARPGELHDSSQAAKLRTTTSLGVQEIVLVPLTESEGRTMLRSLLETGTEAPSPGEERALLRSAAGNPMAIELLVQDWMRCGKGSLSLSVGAMTPDFSAERPAQISYYQILERITQSLDITTQNVLNLASLLGQRLNDLSLYALMDISAGQTMSSMTELVKRRVLRDGPQGLEFVNELLRGAAYLGVPQTLRRVLHSGIADRLIEKHKTGSEDLGLEIAWHCTRAGRIPEATPYLLAGARECLSHGAVHSAERALSSAIPRLTGSEYEEAVILLAEVLQEQGRWQECYDLLQTSIITEPRLCALATILALNAQHWSAYRDLAETVSTIDTLRDLIQTRSDMTSRVRAANVISLLMTSVRNVELAKRSLEAINLIPTSALKLDDLASLAASKSRLLYIAMERGACIAEIVKIGGRLHEARHVNSNVATLHNCLGVIRCCEGRYFDAKAYFQRAYEINASLGNDMARASRACQVALSCFRLGEYREAIEWCEKAAATFGPYFSGYTECQAAYYSGSSYAILGEVGKALQTTESLDRRLPAAIAPWLRQMWLLSKADILLFAGRRADALVAGYKALGEPMILHSKFTAGQFARWLAFTSSTLIHREVVQDRLSEMVKELDTLDFIDQVEVLCAMELLNPTPTAGQRHVLVQRKLAALPASVTEQLMRLRMLGSLASVI